MQRLNKLASVILLVLFSGCAVQQKQLDHLQLQEINVWQAKGKVSVTREGERKSASFSWLNKGESYDIHLHGPFGSGAVRLERRGNKITLVDGKQKLQAASPEELLLTSTGWTLPLSELAWWIKALPAPKVPILNTSTNDQGQLAHLQQQGWNLQFLNYEHVSGHVLPTKIIATHQDLKLVMAIKEWSLRGVQ